MKLKAAEGRHFLPVLRYMLQHFFENESEHAKLRFQCVDALNNVYLELGAWKDGGESSVCIGQLARKHLLLYAELRASVCDFRIVLVFVPEAPLVFACR